MGKLWKKVGVYNSFDEAYAARNEIVAENVLEEYFEIKIKRCDQGGKSFMVKIRYNEPEKKAKPKKKAKKKS